MQQQPIPSLSLPAKITEFEYACFRIEQKVLRLDISMADSEAVNVGETTKQLVHVKLQIYTTLASRINIRNQYQKTHILLVCSLHSLVYLYMR